jgi:hypothetical protein
MKTGVTSRVLISQSTQFLNSTIFKELVFMPFEMLIPQSAGAKTSQMTGNEQSQSKAGNQKDTVIFGWQTTYASLTETHSVESKTTHLNCFHE